MLDINNSQNSTKANMEHKTCYSDNLEQWEKTTGYSRQKIQDRRHLWRIQGLFTGMPSDYIARIA